MENRTRGTVISVKRQWWLKVNTKSVRKGPLDGATFPHIVKVRFVADDGCEIIGSKWLGASVTPPCVGESVPVIYRTDRPKKFRLDIGYGRRI